MGDSFDSSALRSIPAVDRLLADPAIDSLRARYSEDLVKRMIRAALDQLRNEIRDGKAGEDDCELSAVALRVSEMMAGRLGPKLTTVINATGVVVHTNLGRSPLSRRVVERIAKAALSYSNLEYDIARARRGERNSHLRSLIQDLTTAEAALAVNNNAAAVLLALSTLARGREVIVSRGELVEIGGSFRIPDVMERSSAILREVGTTNRTHPADYLNAINENTALILKVHTSNYSIVGFTKEVGLEELAAIGREKGIPSMFDLGSGCLVDLAAYGLEGEPTVSEVIQAGVDVVSFSGDKLMGGPQAGILAGRGDLIERMRTNPLARALRIDKLTLAGLEATLEEYTRAQGPEEGIPTLDMLSKSPDVLMESAEAIAGTLRSTVADSAEVEIVSGTGRVGGGALPLGDLPGPRVAVRPKKISAAGLEQLLRASDPPVIVLVQENTVLIDPRTLVHDQAAVLPDLIAKALERS